MSSSPYTILMQYIGSEFPCDGDKLKLFKKALEMNPYDFWALVDNYYQELSTILSDAEINAQNNFFKKLVKLNYYFFPSESLPLDMQHFSEEDISDETFRNQLMGVEEHSKKYLRTSLIESLDNKLSLPKSIANQHLEKKQSKSTKKLSIANTLLKNEKSTATAWRALVGVPMILVDVTERKTFAELEGRMTPAQFQDLLPEVRAYIGKYTHLVKQFIDAWTRSGEGIENSPEILEDFIINTFSSLDVTTLDLCCKQINRNKANLSKIMDFPLSQRINEILIKTAPLYIEILGVDIADENRQAFIKSQLHAALKINLSEEIKQSLHDVAADISLKPQWKTSLREAIHNVAQLEEPLDNEEQRVNAVLVGQNSNPAEENMIYNMDLLKIIGEVNLAYREHSKKHYVWFWYNTHGKQGIKQANDFMEKVMYATTADELLSVIYTHLESHIGGEKHAHSFRTMLLAAMCQDKPGIQQETFRGTLASLKQQYPAKEAAVVAGSSLSGGNE